MRPGPNRYLAEEPANRTDEIPWGFGLWAQAFGIYDELDKVKVLTNVSAGTGGWGPQCVLANGSVYGVATVSANCSTRTAASLAAMPVP